MLTRRVYIGGVFINAVHLITLVRAQGGGQSPVAHADLDHESALDARRVEDAFGVGIRVGERKPGDQQRRPRNE